MQAAHEPQEQQLPPGETPPKTCRVCVVRKPRSDYHRNHSKQDEMEDVCKACKAQRDAARRKLRAQVRARSHSWGHPWSIDTDDV